MILSLVSIFIPINDRRILFESYSGTSYGCNPKYISEALDKENKYEIFWTYKKNVDTSIFPENVILVRKPSLKFIYIFLSSKVIIDNDCFPLYMPKRKNQKSINTYHGVALKSIGLKKMNNVSKEVKFTLNRNSKMADYALSPCESDSRCFRNDLAYGGIILKTGAPRNDLFWQKNNNICKKVKEKYNIPEDKKLVLYAPTFRTFAKTAQNDIDTDGLKSILSEKFGGEWVVLVRAHHRFKTLGNNDNCIDVSSYPDMQELLYCVDVLISDYSSCMWDFSLMKKPCFVLATDLNEYKASQGFFIPISEWPYDIAVTCDELNENILNFNQAEYEKKVDSFFLTQGSYDDGQATIRVVKIINMICEGRSDEKYFKELIE